MKYLFLQEMIVPKVLNIIYWIASILVILIGLSSIFWFSVSFSSLILGIVYIVLGLISTRIAFEFIYVVFGIYENTKKK